VEAQVVQRRRIRASEAIGYNATFTAEEDCELAILNIGYADGYLRGFSNSGRARIGEVLRSGGRPHLHGPHRDLRRTMLRRWGRAIGSNSISTCRAHPPSPASPNMSC
jgi:hypothetical protein